MYRVNSVYFYSVPGISVWVSECLCGKWDPGTKDDESFNWRLNWEINTQATTGLGYYYQPQQLKSFLLLGLIYVCGVHQPHIRCVCGTEIRDGWMIWEKCRKVQSPRPDPSEWKITARRRRDEESTVFEEKRELSGLPVTQSVSQLKCCFCVFEEKPTIFRLKLLRLWTCVYSVRGSVHLVAQHKPQQQQNSV